MKKIKNLKNTICAAGLLIVLISLSSCLKNDKYFIDFSTAGASVDLPLAAANSNGVVTFAYPATLPSASIPIYVNAAAPSPLGKAVTGTLALDTAFLNNYNNNNGTSYILLPDSTYTLSKGLTFSVPAGKRLDSTVLVVNFQKLDLTQSYVFPVTIQTANVPIEQWNHLLINVSVKNKYDGVYTVTGTLVDHASSAIVGNYPFTANLITAGPSSVYFDPHPILSGTTSSYYGEFGPQFNFDANDNIISVVNIYGQPSPSRLRAAQLASGAANKYNADGSIDVSYDMYQGGSLRTEFVEHFTYVGPRP